MHSEILPRKVNNWTSLLLMQSESSSAQYDPYQLSCFDQLEPVKISNTIITKISQSYSSKKIIVDFEFINNMLSILNLDSFCKYSITTSNVLN